MATKILGINGMTPADLQAEIERGARFVMFTYCISVLVMTFRRPSDIYFVRAGESATVKGLPFVFISLFLGWWGIPWGPIWTIGSFVTNLGGGKDVTSSVLSSLSTTAVR